METVVVEMSMSLDGFIAGPEMGVERPLGMGGLRLHDWLFHSPPGSRDAEIARQALAAGLVDELRIQLVPVLLGAGTRLFEAAGGSPVELAPIAVIESPLVTHLWYRVTRGPVDPPRTPGLLASNAT